MSINSKRKGAQGEREFARLCRDQGYEKVRRGQQFNGIEGDDVVNLPGIHVECKRVEKLNIYDAMSQAMRDRKTSEIPIVAHRKNNHEWLITMKAENWFDLFREWECGRKPIEKLCENCKHRETDVMGEPCQTCIDVAEFTKEEFTKWEAEE